LPSCRSSPPLKAVSRRAITACMLGHDEELSACLVESPAAAQCVGFKDCNGYGRMYGDSLLHCASYFGDEGCVKILIDAGADIRVSGDNDLEPLLIALCAGSAGCARMLIDAGADPRQRTKTGRSRALHYAVNSGNHDCVKLIVELGEIAPASDVWSGGFSPLHVGGMIGKCNPLILKTLLSAGFEADAHDEDGMALMGRLVQRHRFMGDLGTTGLLECVRLLVAADVDVRAVDRLGNSYLHLAACSGIDAMASFLLSLGLDATAKNHSGKSPLHLACARKDKGVGHLVQILLAPEPTLSNATSVELPRSRFFAKGAGTISRRESSAT
jgi:ankyrin repeat protein